MGHMSLTDYYRLLILFFEMNSIEWNVTRSSIYTFFLNLSIQILIHTQFLQIFQYNSEMKQILAKKVNKPHKPAILSQSYSPRCVVSRRISLIAYYIYRFIHNFLILFNLNIKKTYLFLQMRSSTHYLQRLYTLFLN